MKRIDKSKLLERGWGARILVSMGTTLILIWGASTLVEEPIIQFPLVISLGFFWGKFLKTKTGDYLFALNDEVNERIVDSIDPEKFEENFKDEVA